MEAYWVYILTNKPRATLYVGVTNDLIRRTYEHREGLVRGFTQRYGLKMLVHFERYDTPNAAIQREKNIKHWPRLWSWSSSSPAIRNGGISTTTSFAEPPHGLPGQARQ